MVKVEPAKSEEKVEPGTTLQDFLQNVPPGRKARLDESSTERKFSSTWYLEVKVPWLSLHCSYPACDRVQYFISAIKEFVPRTAVHDVFIEFSCRNCARTVKTFALRILSSAVDQEKVFAYKFGEVPPFGPPLPAKLLQLAGGQGDLLKKGRQSENQSLGIGAFAYYRRVVEEQKSRLIDELKNAIERLGQQSKGARCARIGT